MEAEKFAPDMIEKHEHGHTADRRHSAVAAQHGDRALALLGDERVRLTEEDVSLSHSSCCYGQSCVADQGFRTNVSAARPIKSSSPS